MLGDSRGTADIVVIGAGVMGASIAYHLAARGAGRIAVVDKGHVGSGNSSRSSALVRMHYSFEPEVRLALHSLRVFERWNEIFGTPTHFCKTGFVRIVHRDERQRLEANVAMQRSVGANVQLISGAQLRELEPAWEVDDVDVAAYEPDSGYGDGATVAGDMLAKARELGADYLPSTAAIAIDVKGGRVQGVATERGRIESRTIVCATGPWSGALCGPIGLDLPIETELHEVAMLRSAAGHRSGRCACIDSVTEVYFRSEGRGQALVGDFFGRRGVDPDRFPQRASVESLAGLVERACRRVPALASAELCGDVTGVYDMTPDARPLLGGAPDIEGLYVAAGFSGMGFKISPAVGLTMSELIIDGRAMTIDISAFRPSRFAEGRPIKAQFEYRSD